MFKRLYLTVLASLLLFALLAGITFKLFSESDDDNHDRGEQILYKLVNHLLPVGAAPEQINQQLLFWHEELRLDLALYSADGVLLGQAGALPPGPSVRELTSVLAGGRNWRRLQDSWVVMVPLELDRVLVSRSVDQGHGWSGSGAGFASVIGVLLMIGVAVAIVAYPTARRATRRLVALQRSVDAFGSGDLAARAPVKGKDDIASLARHFNQSADRIANLLRAQKSLLANASHELRSPLARIRMAVTLFNQPGLGTSDRDAASRELLRNVTELDELVDELLTASRLDASSAGAAVTGVAEPWEDFDFGGLIAEECARLDLSPSVSSQEVFGDRRLLRRLVRNLLENAMRYGHDDQHRPDEAITVSLHAASDAQPLQFSVCDRGPGVPSDEAERIFEPFYRLRGASEKAGGVGLGLSLVRQIAQHHQGKVSCEARSGGGSCFQVLLPAKPGGKREP